MDWSTCSAVEQTPGIVSGVWVFAGARIPVTALFENLADGITLEEFLELFEGASLEQIKVVLAHAQVGPSSFV
jgi:uncharacterized protein (DUF433 family)